MEVETLEEQTRWPELFWVRNRTEKQPKVELLLPNAFIDILYEDLTSVERDDWKTDTAEYATRNIDCSNLSSWAKMSLWYEKFLKPKVLDIFELKDVTLRSNYLQYGDFKSLQLEEYMLYVTPWIRSVK